MRFDLTLSRKEQLAEFIYGLWFKSKEGKVDFKPGQFLEWTLNHKNPDSRGVKRFFTIASSPTEKDILLATKIIESPSTFKESLKNFEVGDEIVVEGSHGDFILPEKKDKKLVFVAGGIGVTPFRSIIKYLVDKKEKRNITLFYGTNSEEEMVFRNLFSQAERSLNLEIVYTVKNGSSAWQGEVGYIDGEMIKKYIKNISDCVFYVSGPEPMVHGTSDMLIKTGVNEKQIKHDYFPGYSET